MLRDPIRLRVNAPAGRLFAAALRKAAIAPSNGAGYRPHTTAPLADVQVRHDHGRTER